MSLWKMSNHRVLSAENLQISLNVITDSCLTEQLDFDACYERVNTVYLLMIIVIVT